MPSSDAIEHPAVHYHDFVDFGDAEGYRTRLPLLRADLKPPPDPKR